MHCEKSLSACSRLAPPQDKPKLIDQHCGMCKCKACSHCKNRPHPEGTYDTRGPYGGLCCFHPAGATGCDPGMPSN